MVSSEIGAVRVYFIDETGLYHGVIHICLHHLHVQTIFTNAEINRKNIAHKITPNVQSGLAYLIVFAAYHSANFAWS